MNEELEYLEKLEEPLVNTTFLTNVTIENVELKKKHHQYIKLILQTENLLPFSDLDELLE